MVKTKISVGLKPTQTFDIVDLLRKHAKSDNKFTETYRSKVVCDCGYEGETLLIPTDGGLGSYQYSCNRCGQVEYLPHFGVFYKESLVEGDVELVRDLNTQRQV